MCVLLIYYFIICSTFFSYKLFFTVRHPEVGYKRKGIYRGDGFTLFFRVSHFDQRANNGGLAKNNENHLKKIIAAHENNIQYNIIRKPRTHNTIGRFLFDMLCSNLYLKNIETSVVTQWVTYMSYFINKRNTTSLSSIFEGGLDATRPLYCVYLIYVDFES